MAEVIPFPRVRDRRFIFRHARRMTEMRVEKSQGYLVRLLDQQQDGMLRKGVAPDVALQHRRAMECAIGATLWQVVMSPGGAA